MLTDSAMSKLLTFIYLFFCLSKAMSGAPSLTADMPAANKAVSFPPVTSTAQSGLFVMMLSRTDSTFFISDISA